MCLRALGTAVTLCDVEQRFVNRAMETIAKNLDREVAKNQITAEQKAATLGRISARPTVWTGGVRFDRGGRRRKSLRSSRRFSATSMPRAVRK